MANATSTRPRLATQTFWLTASQYVNAVVNAILPIILVRLLVPAEFGVYRQIYLLSATAVSLASFGMVASATYFLPRHPERGAQIVFNVLLYNIAIGALPFVALLFRPDILQYVSRATQLQAYAAMLGFLIFLTLASSLLPAVPTLLQDVRGSTAIIIGTSALKVVTSVAALLISPSVGSLVTASIVNLVGHCLILLLYLRKQFGSFWRGFDLAAFKQQIIYAIPLGLSGILYIVQRDAHNYFVARSMSPAAFAIYSVGCLQVPFAFILSESLSAVTGVRMSALQQEGRHREVLALTARSVNVLSAVHFPMTALLLVAGPDIIVLLYTAAYRDSIPIFQINLTLLPLAVVMINPLTVAYAELRKLIVFVRTVIVLSLICALYIGIHYLGMMGAILAAVIAAAVERVVIGAKACKLMGMRANDVVLFRGALLSAAVSAAAAIAAFAVRIAIPDHYLPLRIAATGASFGLVYVAGAFAFRLPGLDEALPIASKIIARLRPPARS